MFVYGCYSLSSHLTCKYGKMIISKVPDARCIQKRFHLLLPEWPSHKPASKIWQFFISHNFFTPQNPSHHEHSAITFKKNLYAELQHTLSPDSDESFVEVRSAKAKELNTLKGNIAEMIRNRFDWSFHLCTDTIKNLLHARLNAIAVCCTINLMNGRVFNTADLWCVNDSANSIWRWKIHFMFVHRALTIKSLKIHDKNLSSGCVSRNWSCCCWRSR